MADSLKDELMAKQAVSSAAPAGKGNLRTQYSVDYAPGASSVTQQAVPSATPAAQKAVPSATPASTAASTSVSEVGTSSIPAYADPDRAKAINDLYDAQIAAQKASLQGAYDESLSQYEGNRKSIAKRYQQQRNAAATDYERQRRNFNEQAMMNGLGTGVGSQAALAQNAAYQKQQGTINAAEGTDVSNLERSIADLKTKYQNDINAAVADNDYKRAAALLDEYNAAYSRAEQDAQIKAQYGDFSGYATLYGDATATQMRDTWMRQNPGIAYSLGYIGADTYYQLTGRYPSGYSTGSSSGSRSSYYGSSGGNGGNGGPNLDGLPNPSGDTWEDTNYLIAQQAQRQEDAQKQADAWTRSTFTGYQDAISKYGKATGDSWEDTGSAAQAQAAKAATAAALAQKAQEIAAQSAQQRTSIYGYGIN